jgi:hypothetical protein
VSKAPKKKEDSPCLAAALIYAKAGFKVFPSPPGTKKSYKSLKFSNGQPWGMSAEPVHIRKDWARWPEANVAIVTGPASDFWVLEIDTVKGHSVDGFKSLKELTYKHGPLPDTRQAISPSGSIHFYFRWSISSGNIINSTSKVGLGIDVRGDGGMVIAPPSIKPSKVEGEPAGEYKWANKNKILDAPDWLIELVRVSDEEPSTTSAEPTDNLLKIKFAVEALPNNVRDWDRWNRLGMAMWRATSGHDDGFTIFNEWSKLNDSYQLAACRERWYEGYATSKPDRIGAATLFWEADQIDPEWRDRYERARVSAQGIIQRGGARAEIIARAEEVLLSNGSPVYQRKGELIRPIKYGQTKKPNLLGEESVDLRRPRRDPNATILLEVEPVWLTTELSTCTTWYTVNSKGKYVVADPKEKYAVALLKPTPNWKFSELRGVIAAPTLDWNGRAIEKPGYDEDSQLLLDFKEGDFPPIPEKPTKEDAVKALEKLNKPLRGFPFEDETDEIKTSQSRSVLLSAILGGVVRPSLRTMPLHGVDSNMPGTGKGKAVSVVGIIATGTRPVAISQGKDSEEDEKRLSALLYEGDPVILIDNCERPITGDFLCSMLVEEVVQARILGLSKVRKLPCTSLVMVTGNNLIFAADTVRRVVKCRLNANMEKPAEREFDFDVLQEVRDNRADLVIAALTILRAYKLAGKPVKLRPMGSFEDYDWVRGALVWLGCDDPATSQEKLYDDDPMKNDLLEVLTAWTRAFGNKSIKLSDIAKAETSATDAVRGVLITAACRESGVWNAKSIGWWLRRHVGQYANAMHLEQDKKTVNSVNWMVLGGQKEADPEDKKRAAAARDEVDIPF